MRVVLVPTTDRLPASRVDYPPLGLLSLHQVLSRVGHECRICTPGVAPKAPEDGGRGIEDWAIEVLAAEPDWVGLSSTACESYPHDLLLARKIRELSPRTPVVLGGPQASAVAVETMAAFPWIDYVVRGEAEGSVLALARLIQGEACPRDVPGLTYRRDAEIRSNPVGPLLEEMDSLDLPSYCAYPPFDEALKDPGLRPANWFLPLEAGRGCPNACAFCSTSAFWRRRRRQKSPVRLAQQARALLARYPVDAVSLEQDLFAVESAWLTEFLETLSGGEPVSWRCQVRTDSVSMETLHDMCRAGCILIFFGIESGSQRVQKVLGKNLDVAHAARMVKAAADCAIQVETSFIVGFPWETRRELQETLSLHARFLDLGVCSRVQLLRPLPATAITQQYGYRLKRDPLRDYRRPGLAESDHAALEDMIQQHPQIFSDYYYIEPELVPREEFVIAAWAANCLQAVMQESAGDEGSGVGTSAGDDGG